MGVAAVEASLYLGWIPPRVHLLQPKGTRVLDYERGNLGSVGRPGGRLTLVQRFPSHRHQEEKCSTWIDQSHRGQTGEALERRKMKRRPFEAVAVVEGVAVVGIDAAVTEVVSVEAVFGCHQVVLRCHRNPPEVPLVLQELEGCLPLVNSTLPIFCSASAVGYQLPCFALPSLIYIQAVCRAAVVPSMAL